LNLKTRQGWHICRNRNLKIPKLRLVASWRSEDGQERNRPQSLVGRASSRAGVRQTVLAARADARPTGYAAPLVAVRKNLDLVWVWFYKDGAPTALCLQIRES
jgi:hypothetical protein